MASRSQPPHSDSAKQTEQDSSASPATNMIIVPPMTDLFVTAAVQIAQCPQCLPVRVRALEGVFTCDFVHW